MPRPVQSVTRIDRSAGVISYLCSQIRAGILLGGNCIPSDHELASALGMRIGYVRQGIACLCTLGVLQRHPVAGMVLAEDPPQLLLDLLCALYISRPRELAEARCFLATELAGLAAHRATEDDHTAMAEEVVEMYSATTPGEHAEHSLRFHRRMAQSAGNSLLAAFAEALLCPPFEDPGESSELSPDLRESARMHSEIYRAIRRSQPDEAKKAMEEHLRLALGRWLCEPDSAEAEEIPCTNGT